MLMMCTIKRKFRAVLLGFLFCFLFFSTHARVVKVRITKTERYSEGKIFGGTGQYERIFGQAFGEVDPNLAFNQIIQDLSLAPRNERGMVEYVSEFVLLRPKDMQKSNGLLFLSLPNRGNVFPADTALLNRGYVYLWCAWQGDVLTGNNRLTMKVPVATEIGKEITGQLRTEYQVTTPTPTLNLSSGAFSGMTHHSYETVSLDKQRFNPYQTGARGRRTHSRSKQRLGLCRLLVLTLSWHAKYHKDFVERGL
jgi:hypothetical protein